MLDTIGEGSSTLTEPHHIHSPEAQQTSPTATSSQSLPPVTTATIPTGISVGIIVGMVAVVIGGSDCDEVAVDEPASLIGDDNQGEACPTGSMQHKLTELTDLCTRLQRQQDEMALKITAHDLEIATLKAKIKHLEDRDGGDDDPSGEDATIKGRRLETGEEPGIERSTEKGSDDTEEMVPTVSIPPAGEVPTGSNVVPTTSPIFTTATMNTPYSKRKELSIGERIELISDLVKYQDNYAKVLKYQIQQRKPLSKKQQKEFYMSVLRSHAGWKTRHFKGMSLEEIREKFIPVWKQIEDFIPIEEVSEEDLKVMMQLVLVEEVYVEALQLWALVKETLNIRQATSDKEKELWVELKRLYEPDVEDQLWIQTQALMHDPVEWRIYDSCGVHHVLLRDQEIFMLVKKEYPLRKGLAIAMIINKLQVENYSQMANDLI
nr:hypothetical protein [Tanacetum cinerariifolium]